MRATVTRSTLARDAARRGRDADEVTVRAVGRVAGSMPSVDKKPSPGLGGNDDGLSLRYATPVSTEGQTDAVLSRLTIH